MPLKRVRCRDRCFWELTKRRDRNPSIRTQNARAIEQIALLRLCLAHAQHRLKPLHHLFFRQKSLKHPRDSSSLEALEQQKRAEGIQYNSVENVEHNLKNLRSRRILPNRCSVLYIEVGRHFYILNKLCALMIEACSN